MSNSNFSWDIIQANPQIKWNYQTMSLNCNITYEILNNNEKLNWNRYLLSMNPNMSRVVVRQYPELYNNFLIFSGNLFYIWNDFQTNLITFFL